MEGETTTTKTDTGNGMRVYFASLADYNAGRLHGVWVDVTPDVEPMQEAIDAMLKESCELVAEEWAIHDYEGFGPVGLREYESLETLARLAAGVDRHGEWFLPLYEAAADIDQAEAWAENDYAGEADSLKEWAEEFCYECHADVLDQLPTLIVGSIDWEAVGNELELGGDVFTVEHNRGVVVFWNR